MEVFARCVLLVGKRWVWDRENVPTVPVGSTGKNFLRGLQNTGAPNVRQANGVGTWKRQIPQFAPSVQVGGMEMQRDK